MIKQIVLSLVIGLVVGTSAGYTLESKYDESKMKESESLAMNFDHAIRMSERGE